MQIKKQQLELDMEQWNGSKLVKEYIKAVYCQPAYLAYIQSRSCKMPYWMKQKLESRLLGEISITSDMQTTPPLWQKAKRNCRASWWRWKRKVKSVSEVSQSCLALSDPMDCSLPGSSIHGIFQAGVLELGAIALSSVQFCNSMDCSTPDFPVLHRLLELAQTHVHWVSDAIQPSHPLSSPSPPAFNLSQHQGLF